MATDSGTNALDAERERLRAKGYTDAEASQILIARETGDRATAVAGHGTMSGFANNLAAAGSYIANFIPSIFTDLGSVFGRRGGIGFRLMAAWGFFFKIFVVLVIAFIMNLEFSQFQSVTWRAKAEACDARNKFLAGAMQMSGASGNPYYRAWLRRQAAFERDCIYNED